MNKHTPGPWSVGGSTEYINQLRIEPTIGIVYGAGDEIKANARLIAAAPELLLVLIECDEAMAYMSEYDIPIMLPERVKAAIAKVKGE